VTTGIVAALVIAGVTAFGGLLLWAALRKAKNEGVLEERDAETQRTNAAKARADAVLAEHRDPDAVDDRLRDNSF
jgi:hypothetical protein